MTCIAYRNGVLAADSCATEMDDERAAFRVRCEKLHVHKIESDDLILHIAVASSGDASAGLQLEECFANRMRLFLHNDFSLLVKLDEPRGGGSADIMALVKVMNRAGTVLRKALYISDGIMAASVESADFYAIGCDGGFALAAMAAGAGASDAVEIAATYACYSALPVRSIGFW